MSTVKTKPKRFKHPFYTTREWYRTSALVRRRDNHQCVFCKADVRGRGKSRVDHIFPYKTHPELGLDMNNLRTLCAACDNSRHAWDRAKSSKVRKAISSTGAPINEPDWV